MKNILKVMPKNSIVKVNNGLMNVFSNKTNFYVFLKTEFEDGSYNFDLLKSDIVEKISDDSSLIFKGEDYKFIGNIKKEIVSILIEASNFVSKDTLRPTLCSVYLTKEEIVSTNSHYLFFKQFDTNFDGEVLINPSIIKLIKDNKSDVIVSENSSNYKFEFNDIVIYQEKVGNFPNYKRVIPQSDFTVTFDKKEMLEIIEKPTAFLKVNNLVPTFAVNIKKDSLNVYVNSFMLIDKITRKTFDENKSIPCKSNQDLTIGFTDFLFKKVVSSFKTKEIKMQYSLPNKGVIFNDCILLMPAMLD